MKKLTKDQSALLRGFVAGVTLTTAIVLGVGEIRKAMTPTEEFVNAKTNVAEAYDMSVENIKLYRHEGDDAIWTKVMDCNQLSSDNELYPNHVYSAEIDGERIVLAVVVVSPYKETFDNMTMYYDIKNIEYSYDETSRSKPVYVAVVDVTDESIHMDINNVISGIDCELEK